MIRLYEFVTMRGAARLLGVSADTTADWHWDAGLPVFQSLFKGCPLFKVADPDELTRRAESATLPFACRGASKLERTRRTRGGWSRHATTHE